MKTYRLRTLLLVCASFCLFGTPVEADWVYDGNAICTAANVQQHVEMVSDGAGGAIMVWEDDRSGEGIYAQRIDGQGNVQWAADGIAICTGSGVRSWPQIISDGAGGAVIAWNDTRSGYAIYAQRVNAAGATQWTANGALVSHSPSYGKGNIDMYPDGAGGAFLAWQDGSGIGAFPNDIWVTHVSAAGAPVWATDGVAVCQVAWNQFIPAIVATGDGGAMVFWRDQRDNEEDVYMQRVAGNGLPQWLADGEAVTNVAGSKHDICAVPDGSGGAIVVWSDDRDLGDIYAQRVDRTGTMLWAQAGVPLCIAPSVQNTIDLIAVAGGAIAAWEDNRPGATGIYAGMITTGGLAPWGSAGVAVSTTASNSESQRLVPDGTGGAVIAWHEFKSASGSYDVFAQRLNSSGTPQWPAGGVPVSTADSPQDFVAIASDDAGGAVIAWREGRNYSASSYDIYAGTVDANGWNRVPTFLAWFTASTGPNGVTIAWALAEPSDGAAFHVMRGEGNAALREIDRVVVGDREVHFEYCDEACAPGNTYRYRVDVTDEDGRAVLFSTRSITVPAAKVMLEQNTPNPFNPVTTIRFYLPEQTHVRLGVFDTRGKLVAQLLDEERPAGLQSVEWNAPAGSARLSSGVYFYRLRAGKTEQTRKMTLLK